MKKFQKWLAAAFAAVAAFCLLLVPTVSAGAATVVDVTQNVSAKNWVTQNELKVTYLSLGENVIPDIGYGIIDQSAYKYAQESIAINGRTVKDINADASLGAADWTYTVFPSASMAAYKLPIIIYVNKGVMEIKLHSELIKTLGNKVEVTAKTGLYFENNGVRYEVTQDRSFVVWQTTEERDITQTITAYGWIAQSEWKVTYVDFGSGVLNSAIEYGIMDKDAYKYIQESIAINGRTVKDINADESLGAIFWTYTVFPSTESDLYKVPVILFVNNGVLEIKLHTEFLKTQGDSVEITVKAGLWFENEGKLYEVMEDKTFLVWEKEEDVIITDAVALHGWQVTGTASELTYTMLSLGKGVLPEVMDYGIIDNEYYQYLQDYIAINGQTIRTINTESVTDWYEFSTFPSTESDLYKVPVLLFENNGVLEIKFHNSYLRTLLGRVEITIKEGFSIINGDYNYVVDRDICFTYVNDVWADKNRTYAISYFVNGVPYGETQYLPFNSPLVMLDAPETQTGYVFSGWECEAVEGVVQDMEIHGYLRPIRYSIYYSMNGGVNAPVNPIVYYVTDGEIVLQDATKEGATFQGWYLSPDFTQKVESITPDMAGDIVLYARFVGGETKSGCGATLSVGGVVTALAAAMLVCIKKKEN